ncbi:hypothetical protein ACFQY7_42935 [Actinomadura luteofluorescens]|uniref:Uncharacterized protein n=1 Tax=Actinomadura luteofluorescens TaxID=46163 RepID=A0A7Y9JGL7_9ACTN|nr:hypothetical protein [Actinomadura luteofluorescens]NYD47751.1 hypothetical protein [Actinomadura luteofluorescens]
MIKQNVNNRQLFDGDAISMSTPFTFDARLGTDHRLDRGERPEAPAPGQGVHAFAGVIVRSDPGSSPRPVAA